MAYSLHIHAIRVSNCTTVVVQNRTWYDEKDDRTLVREGEGDSSNSAAQHKVALPAARFRNTSLRCIAICAAEGRHVGQGPWSTCDRLQRKHLLHHSTHLGLDETDTIVYAAIYVSIKQENGKTSRVLLSLPGSILGVMLHAETVGQNCV